MVVNNSHSVASMASILANFNLIVVIHKRGNIFRHSTQNLDKYFIPKNDITISEKYLERLKRGIGYIKTASHYVFQKVKQK